MTGAGEALQAAAAAALQAIGGFAVHEGEPLQAVHPYATVEAGAERDWSCKDIAGRDVRLAVTLWDKGERPARLRALSQQAEERLDALGGEIGSGWRLIVMRFLRSRLVRTSGGRGSRAGESPGWAATIEYRALLLRTS